MGTTTTGDGAGLRRVTGWLLVIGAVTFAAAATVLSSTFDWPDILREPPDVVLPAFMDGGTSLVWTWFAVAWTYAILLVPILLLPAALGRRHDAVLRAATFVGAASVLLSLIGFLRWVFVVPALADSYVAGDATTKAARWAGCAGLVASVLSLTGQGDILATAVPSFPVWDLGGLLGSTLWGLWVIPLGVAVLRVPVRRPTADPSTATAPATPGADPA
jgi:hypothetical protein